MTPPLVVLSCGNCGADVPITSPATVTVTCGHCGTLSHRSDVDLESIGEVACPAPLTSRFEIGTEGRLEGRAFVVRGQIQLDHGAGLWNEWAAESDEGWIWLAEAQGEIQMFEEVADTVIPAFDPSLVAGDHVQVGDGRPWTLRERGEGTVMTFKGEFPIRMTPGTRTKYVDLVRGASEVATLDFTRSGTPEFLRGRLVQPSELHINPSTAPDYTPSRLESIDVRCPNCGGTIEVQDSERALGLGCQHCGTLLERANQLEAFSAVEGEAKIRSIPAIPIGAVGVVQGEEITVLGFLERSVTSEGVRYPWHEYLGRNSQGQYRWLVESNGHWTFARPVVRTQLEADGAHLEIAGNRARMASSSAATVDAVLGEFYWQVRVGDTVQTRDYIAPSIGRIASIESTADEIAATLGRHVDRDELEGAFPGANLPEAHGVGLVQPNPHSFGDAWKVFVLFVLALSASCVATQLTSANDVVYSGKFGPVANAGGLQTVDFTEPFDVRANGKNVRISLSGKTIDNGYLAFDCALVHEDSGEVRTFTAAVQRYSGVSGGEKWSEGRRRSRTHIGPVPRGSYRLRIAATPYDRAASTTYEVEVRSDVPRGVWYFLALLLLVPIPAFVLLRHAGFETRRWADAG